MDLTPYTALKSTHVACVALSYSLFLVRGVWMMRAPDKLARRWVRVVPHLIDTMLLGSAIGMLVVLGLNPFAVPWLTAKIAGLIVYIGLGMMALRRGRTRGGRIAAWIAAQAVFAYIVAVALTKNALLL